MNAARSVSSAPAPRAAIRRRVLPGRSDRNRQRQLFCSCGQGTPATAGLCPRCYRARAHSRSRFAGNREQVLERDRHSCQICGETTINPRRLHVHHRNPGIHDPGRLVSLCAACHARLHRFQSVRVWLPERLVDLWAEQHPGVPRQLQFSFGDES